MSEEKITTKQLTETIWSGVITDSKNRKIQLRNPTPWDEFLVNKAMGNVDNALCRTMIWVVLRVASIDGIVMSTPLRENQFAVSINQIGNEGIQAISKHFHEALESMEDEETQIKKSLEVQE